MSDIMRGIAKEQMLEVYQWGIEWHWQPLCLITVGIDVKHTNINIIISQRKAKMKRQRIEGEVKKFLFPNLIAAHWDGHLYLRGNKRLCAQVAWDPWGVEWDLRGRYKGGDEVVGLLDQQRPDSKLVIWYNSNQLQWVVGACFHLELWLDRPIL